MDLTLEQLTTLRLKYQCWLCEGKGFITYYYKQEKELCNLCHGDGIDWYKAYIAKRAQLDQAMKIADKLHAQIESRP